MHTVIAELEQAQIRSDLPDFRPGDTLKVHCLLYTSPSPRD